MLSEIAQEGGVEWWVGWPVLRLSSLLPCFLGFLVASCVISYLLRLGSHLPGRAPLSSSPIGRVAVLGGVSVARPSHILALCVVLCVSLHAGTCKVIVAANDASCKLLCAHRLTRMSPTRHRDMDAAARAMGVGVGGGVGGRHGGPAPPIPSPLLHESEPSIPAMGSFAPPAGMGQVWVRVHHGATFLCFDIVACSLMRLACRCLCLRAPTIAAAPAKVP